MSTYYVTHPNLSITALVQAPATEKARTTFLDYLERRDLIGRADRQYWRRNMVAERMEYPEDVTADVELSYGYEEGGRVPPLPPQRQQRYGDIVLEEGAFPDEPQERAYQEAGERWRREHPALEEESPEEPQQPTQETPKKMSPIARAALRGYVE